MMDSPAWQDLSATAQALYLCIVRRYRGPGSNNGEISYSVREGAAALKVSPATVSRALRSLVSHGFLIPMKLGAFSLKLRHATEWRLTEFPCDVTKAVTASKDFMRWQPPQIQNAVPAVKPTVPVVKPNGARSETRVAKMARDGG
jgi:hypothetical protein